MDMVTQRIEQNNEQKGVQHADKKIFKQDTHLLELPIDTVLKDCLCGVVGCAAEIKTPEDRMVHSLAGSGDQAAPSPDTELVRLWMLFLELAPIGSLLFIFADSPND